MGNALRLGISRIGLRFTKWRMKTKCKRKSMSVLILGLQASGKTTIALRLWKFKRILPDSRYVQTKGFNTYTIRRTSRSSINLYDLGGHSSIQELWEYYYADAHGVIFVVDVSDRATISEAGELFSKVLNDERIKGKPVLLLANKHELDGAATEVELDRAMNLQELVNSVQCLTRLEESTATDLKNDKGIFEGFRWLVSYIEKHYHEINERVIEDTLVEQNKEKARRAAVKDQLGTISNSPSPANSKSAPTDRRPSQKSQRSLKYVKTESRTDLIPSEDSFSNSKTNEMKTNPEGRITTNYLIKSRPSSSSQATRNPFLIERNISTAPASRQFLEKSQPTVHEMHSRNPDQSSKPKQEEDESRKILVKSCSREYVDGSTVGRLSPEGADSDEGIVNPAFDISTEESQSVGILNKRSNSVGVFRPPEKIVKLIGTEFSDMERPAEITMVTTLVQVHEDLFKDRRASTTSTHESVAISINSLKSEGTEEGSRGETSPTSAASTPIGAGSIGTTGSIVPPSSGRLSSVQNEKEKRKFSLRGKNKTGPLPPGIGISTVQSSLQSPNHSRFSATTTAVPTMKKTRESLPGSGNSKLKKKSLSGFSDSLEAQSGSQFVREVTSSQMERLKKY